MSRQWRLALMAGVSCVVAGGLVLGVSSAQIPLETGESVPTFGVTVVAPFGFCGRIYELPVDLTVPIRPSDADLPRTPSEVPGAVSPAIAGHNACSTRLPKFERVQPIGKIYTTRLNVPSRDFREGFPGVTGRFEWFAIDYSARFWIGKTGEVLVRVAL
jgi:hypothetical protein